jgi:hypothetical protein
MNHGALDAPWSASAQKANKSRNWDKISCAHHAFMRPAARGINQVKNVKFAEI